MTQDGTASRPGFGKKSSGWQELRGDFGDDIVQEEDSGDLALEKGIKFFEVSAKDAQGTQRLG